MRFLFVGSWVSHSLPPHGRLPFRSWLLLVLLVFLTFVMITFNSHTGDLNPLRTVPMLGTHKAWVDNPLPRRESEIEP